MQYDFDQVVDRSKNLSAKYDERVKKFGTDDVIPLWIADMEAEGLAAELYEISADKLQKYLLVIVHRGDEEKTQELLRPFGFSAVTFQGMTGTAAENIRSLERELEANKRLRMTPLPPSRPVRKTGTPFGSTPTGSGPRQPRSSAPRAS